MKPKEIDMEIITSFLILLIRHEKGVVSTLEKILEYLKKDENAKAE